MALIPYEPDADDAQGLSRVFETAQEEEFSVHNVFYATAKFIYKPICDEILALIALVYNQFVVLNKTADYTLLAADNRKTGTNAGAVSQVIYTLPAAAVGQERKFYVSAAYNLRVLSIGTDTIRYGASVSIAAGYIQSAAVGSYVKLECFAAGKWIVTSVIANWDVQTS